jgi:hypothetical protein
MSSHISRVETSKIVKKALKDAFPTVKFSVRSECYSGGASMNVNWTDGPSTYVVKQITDKFEGATFDGMQDLKEYHESVYHGETVRFGVDFIFCNRHYSDEFLLDVATSFVQKWHRQESPEFIREAYKQGNLWSMEISRGRDCQTANREFHELLETVI